MPKSVLPRAMRGEIVGGAWLCREHGINPVQPLRYNSVIGSRDIRREINGRHEDTFQLNYAPENTLTGHLEFMLRHERIHLEVLSRLFAKTGYDQITDWMKRQPTGGYSRRIAWFYEWLTGKKLDVPDIAKGSYLDALEDEKYWTATHSQNDARFRIRNNMPGTPDLCPMVYLEEQTKQAIKEVDIINIINQLKSDFGTDLLRKASIWLTSKESRSSFQIEGEKNANREDRFAAAMEMHLGRVKDLFGEDLEMLQREVLGSQALHYGLRKSPIFVGQTVRYTEVIHYIAPSFEDVPKMMTGLREIMARTDGSEAIVRAAVLSFAFVYVHPMCDGNGRLSRFIVNDILRRDQVVQEPLIIPVSVTICKDMASYDRVLDSFSGPLRRQYLGSSHFGKEVKYPDGEISNFEFDEYSDALHAWKYLDLTDHVIYMAKIIGETLRIEMVEEAEYLRNHYQIRARLSEVIQASDNSLDRIIRSVSENKKITGVLKAEYTILDDDEICERVLQAVVGDNSS